METGRGLKQLLELLVVFSSLLQYSLGHHTALCILVQLQETHKYPIYYEISIFYCKYWLLLWWWFFFPPRTMGAGFGAVLLYLHQHALLVSSNHCCSDTFTEIPLSYIMTNKPSSACVVYHSMCCFFADSLWPPHVFLLQASFIRIALSEHCLFSTAALQDKIISSYQIRVVVSWTSFSLPVLLVNRMKTQKNSLTRRSAAFKLDFELLFNEPPSFSPPFLSLFINNIWKLSL